MPGLNHSGPLGQGPRTGKGMGRCNPENGNKESEDHVLGRRGRGRGRGFHRNFGMPGQENTVKGRGRGFGRGRNANQN